MDKYKFLSYSTITQSHLLYRAIKFIEGISNPVIILGKPTPWSSENRDLVPSPLPSISNIPPEPIIIKRVERLLLANESSCGELIYKGKNWNLFQPEEIQYIEGVPVPSPSHIYVAVNIVPSDFNTETFRVIAFNSEIIFKDYVNLNQLTFFPSDIESWGYTHFITFCSPIYRLEKGFPLIEIMMKV